MPCAHLGGSAEAEEKGVCKFGDIVDLVPPEALTKAGDVNSTKCKLEEIQELQASGKVLEIEESDSTNKLCEMMEFLVTIEFNQSCHCHTHQKSCRVPISFFDFTGSSCINYSSLGNQTLDAGGEAKVAATYFSFLVQRRTPIIGHENVERFVVPKVAVVLCANG